MNLELFIAKRLAYSKDKKTFTSRPIIRIALAGVAIGFSVMIIAVSIVIGFKEEIRNKVIGFGSHIQISNYDENNSYESRPIDKEQKFLQVLKNDKEIKHIQVFATKPAIVKSADQIEGVVCKGVGTDFDWKYFKDHLTSGKIFSSQDSTSSDSVVISEILAKKLKLKVGDDLITFFIQQPPRARRFHIAGIYNTGLEEFDKLYMFCDIGQIQKLNDWNRSQVGGYEIAIQNFDNLDQIGDNVYNLIPSELNARTIKDLYPQIFDWLGLQNINAIIIITLMIVVSGMNMISALLIIILERVNMIGMLKALGSPNFSIRKVFIYLAGFLTGKGLLWGNVIGLTCIFIQSYFKPIQLDESSYYISYVPIVFSWSYLAILNLGTLLVCVVMMTIPTLIITKIKPLSAIRYS
ncbi:MAG TPA: ABC transporter permease [Bacteroidia bacterium]|nr:ABC transporter permease [Bacteroidota bacterium]MBP9789528.1 ABC transporter permease [Bacteroidia bacterium]MBK7429741.1 ABC transporter permease [Bacteroidota bacterium]MBK7572082.1 ABC transporter permease [Bacteroidota bacterium]HQV99248.1 ABC transporter permease [Bacteroidia bacterium]